MPLKIGILGPKKEIRHWNCHGLWLLVSWRVAVERGEILYVTYLSWWHYVMSVPWFKIRSHSDKISNDQVKSQDSQSLGWSDFGVNPPKKGLFQHNKGHLGSRCTIYTWNPNDPCFVGVWTLFWRDLLTKNRGHSQVPDISISCIVKMSTYKFSCGSMMVLLSIYIHVYWWDC